MDALPLSPSSAVRSFRALRDRTPTRHFSPPPPSSPTYDPRTPPCVKHQHAPPPNLSLRRTLEQRNLLPTREAPALQAANASTAVVGANDSPPPPQSLLPSLRYDHMARAERPKSSDHGRHSPGSNDTFRYNRSVDSRSSVDTSPHHLQQEPPFQTQPHQHSRQETAPATPEAPPAAPWLHDGSAHSSTAPVTGHSRRRTMTTEERRRARTCVIDGCGNYIVDNHRCFRHGGGKRCAINGCNSSAKQLGLCWRHGGSVLCKVEGCTRGTKVKGLCWGHGGGKKKKQATAQPSASSSDSSGPRCIFNGCQNAAVLHSFCDRHSQEVMRPGYIFEL